MKILDDGGNFLDQMEKSTYLPPRWLQNLTTQTKNDFVLLLWLVVARLKCETRQESRDEKHIHALGDRI